jgi:hypothetical protein
MSQKTNGYIVTNGNNATIGYVSDSDCCITNNDCCIASSFSKNAYSGSYVTYSSNKYTDAVFQR